MKSIQTNFGISNENVHGTVEPCLTIEAGWRQVNATTVQLVASIPLRELAAALKPYLEESPHGR